MAVNQKILKALKSAIANLDDLVEALDGKDGKPLENDVWHAASELEYSLFLFSIAVEDEIDKSKWKLNKKLKKAEVEPTLVEAQKLIVKAEKYMKDEELLEAYKNASIARSCLLKLQKHFTKKKRKALKNKKRNEKIDYSSL